jgi:succinate dehydrogenase hydrophobic anchor subunit
MNDVDGDVADKKSSLFDVVIDAVSGIQYKFFILMFIIFMIISTDVFASRVLGKFEGTIEGKNITSWGTMLQGTFLVLACIIIHAGIDAGIV